MKFFDKGIGFDCQIKPLYSLYYVYMCNEFAWPKKYFSDGLTLETLSNLTGLDLNLRPPTPERNALPLDQLAG